MSDCIKLAKNVRKNVSQATKTKEDQISLEKLKTGQVLKGENLFSEITKRLEILELKYDQDLSVLGDYQLLDINQDKTLDQEFNTVLEKVTDLSSLVPGGGSEVQELLNSASAKRDTVSDKRNEFLKKLKAIVESRDVTPDKLKNASTLDIDLPKFSGYSCEMDFYTFKSKFIQLFEPVVQKPYLSDYLKRNHLSGSALTLVENETEYSEIWRKLKESFGNERLLLQNKIARLENVALWKVRGDEKTADALASLLNTMRDLSTLASTHKIENQLYEGGGLEKVMSLLGNDRHRRFRIKHVARVSDKKSEWEKLSEFLKEELALRNSMILDTKSAQLMGIELRMDVRKKEPEDPKKFGGHTGAFPASHNLICHFCEGVGHTVITTQKGNKIIPYYVCETFVLLSPANRYTKMKEKELCTSCLVPGQKKGPKHRCFYLNFCCPQKHNADEKVHVLLCEEHKKEDKNVKLLEKFKTKFILNSKESLPIFCRNISCFAQTFHVSLPLGSIFKELNSLPDVEYSAIFALQTIQVLNVRLNLFFDNGCGDLVIKQSAAEKLTAIGRGFKLVQDSIEINGVCDQKSYADGVYAISLPLFDGTNITLSGLCVPKITSEFPTYPLSDVESDCKKWSEGVVMDLPRLPASVGGETDILIGSKYLRYFPKIVFEHITGLGVYLSKFQSHDGSRGVVNGPHPRFSEIESEFRGNLMKPVVCFSEPVQLIRSGGTWKNPLLGMKVDPTDHIFDFPTCCSRVDSIDSLPNPADGCSGDTHFAMVSRKPPECVKRFDAIEEVGSAVTYRCVDCRGCQNCLNGPRIDAVSIQEEVEDAMIKRCVTVDPEKGTSTAKLPFVTNPDSRIAVDEQRNLAMRVFNGQVKALNMPGREKDKAAVLESEKKLQDLGFVDWLDNLSQDEQDLVLKNGVYYLIPWRAVHNENSVSTPTRLVFDASQGTKNGDSLNSLLAKGFNSLNNLVEIAIRWRTHPHAFTTDISKMYNRVGLEPSHWKYQLYFWVDDLQPGVQPRIKVIKTLIYGVRPSGNLAQCALRRTAELCAEKFPCALDPILKDTYMDDCISGSESPEASRMAMDHIQCTTNVGGFDTKGFVYSGEDPPEALSDGKDFILAGGTKWFPKQDLIALNIGPVNFSKRVRGKKSEAGVGVVPDVLTKRNCVSRSSEPFDIVGLLAPILGGLKLDISELHICCSLWDDPIPSHLKEIWVQNFGLIDEIRHLKFRRAVVPSDAVSLDMETIETADAGEKLVCAAIYVRFKRKNGTFSCQLIFARTKIVHDLSTPRAELEAALLNASSGHIVRLSLKDRITKSWKLSDSQVTLHWINCVRYALKMWVRSRVVEILRLASIFVWHYVRRKDNIADLGTRKGAQIEDVGPESDWINGLAWMRDDEENFPLVEVKQLVLSAKEKGDADKEKIVTDDECSNCFVSRSVPVEVGDRYEFSKYLIDPNKFRFKTVLRILALVFIFLIKITEKWNQKYKKSKSLAFLRKRDFSVCASNNITVTGHYFVAHVNFSPKVNTVVVHVTDEILNAAKAYFFEKASSEVIHFLDRGRYEKISTLNDGILYHTGRILLVQEIDGREHLADACLDLSAATFCVPITDALSPVAYAIVAETHWHSPDVSHGGVESVLRYAQQTAYIIGGRTLVKSMKKLCARCRFLHKRGVRVAMGPVSDDGLRIAPPFYVSQVDLCGHFSAYSPANKRATLKVWVVVFCCSVTGAVDCRIMEDYSADGFLMSFSRFACRFGYPKKLLPDEGGQLVKGCTDMIISMSDVRHRLSVEHGVEFETCPVGAHYYHGKVERKIQEVKKSLSKNISNKRLSILQWETLCQQISNSINNLPIGIGNKSELLENLDILTPNRLILGRNNTRSPTAPLEITHDVRKIIQSNNEVFKAWFKEWVVSYVPLLVDQPKWFLSDRSVAIGDVVLILKSDKVFDLQYQYGLVVKTFESKDGIIRSVEVEYQNPGENVKRRTTRGVRELVVIHPVDELSLSEELYNLANDDSSQPDES